MEVYWIFGILALCAILLLLWGLFRHLKCGNPPHDVEQGIVTLPPADGPDNGTARPVLQTSSALGGATPITARNSTPQQPKPPEPGILNTIQKLFRTSSRTSIRSIARLRDSMRSTVSSQTGRQATTRTSTRTNKPVTLVDAKGSVSKRIIPPTSQPSWLASDWVGEVAESSARPSTLPASARVGFPESSSPTLPASTIPPPYYSLPAASVSVVRPKRLSRPSLDLHGMRYREARVEIHKFLRRNRNREVEIITGRGLHSHQGRSVMKPLLEGILDDKGLCYETIHKGGSYIVDNE